MNEQILKSQEVQERIVMKQVLTFSPHQVDKLYAPLGKSFNINIQNGMRKSGKLSNIVNENNMSALNNYLEKNNATVYVEDLSGDFFHDVKFHVFKHGTTKSSGFPFSFESAKEDFANCMRSLYKNVEIAIKKIKA